MTWLKHCRSKQHLTVFGHVRRVKLKHPTHTSATKHHHYVAHENGLYEGALFLSWEWIRFFTPCWAPLLATAVLVLLVPPRSQHATSPAALQAILTQCHVDTNADLFSRELALVWCSSCCAEIAQGEVYPSEGCCCCGVIHIDTSTHDAPQGFAPAR